MCPSDLLFGGVTETVPDRVAALSALNRPIVSVLNGGDRVFAREAGIGVPRSRYLNKAEAVAVGKGYATALNEAPGEVFVIVPTEARDTAAAWLSNAFLATYRQTESHRLVHGSGSTHGRDAIQHILHVIKEAAANVSTPPSRDGRRSLWGTRVMTPRYMKQAERVEAAAPTAPEGRI